MPRPTEPLPPPWDGEIDPTDRAFHQAVNSFGCTEPHSARGLCRRALEQAEARGDSDAARSFGDVRRASPHGAMNCSRKDSRSWRVRVATCARATSTHKSLRHLIRNIATLLTETTDFLGGRSGRKVDFA
jgi:hypothetical protein